MSIYIYVDPDSGKMLQTTNSQLGYAYGFIAATLIDAGQDYSEDPAYAGVGIPRNLIMRRNLPIQYSIESLRQIYEPFVVSIKYEVLPVQNDKQEVKFLIVTNTKNIDNNLFI